MIHNFFIKKLLPAITLPEPNLALPVAESILKAGLNVMEVTFRTEATLLAITSIVKEFPEIHVGAGTILNCDQLVAAKNAGASFGLSPGFKKDVAVKALEQKFPFIPGIMSPSEIEQASGYGFDILKVFPVASIGGADYMKSLIGPYGHTEVQFIPMGGVNEENLYMYMQCASVLAVGGSWLCPTGLIKRKKFRTITNIIQRSIELVKKEEQVDNTKEY